MPAPRSYPQVLRERAMRLVADAREQKPELSLAAPVEPDLQSVRVNRDCAVVASRPPSTRGSGKGSGLYANG